ncbi:galectin-12 isoform X2 [Engystomops pustulosus]|uniref:galectin-12 isoform X2 n=1 Tax=Engystomops pustulosus TaxID=76066 RepID=UPI003AFB3112
MPNTCSYGSPPPAVTAACLLPGVYRVVPYICTIFGGLQHGQMILIQGNVGNNAVSYSIEYNDGQVGTTLGHIYATDLECPTRIRSCRDSLRSCVQFPACVTSPAEVRRSSPSSSWCMFQIDFQCGCSTRPRSDIAFHFNPRFSSSNTHVICNTLRKDQWMDELKFSGFPLRKGESFVLLFLFLTDKVKVSVGGQHFLDFPYRLPLRDVDTLGIYGDVDVKEISFLSSNPFHEALTEYPTCQPLKPGNSELNPPLSKLFPVGLSEGRVILARGLVTDNPAEIILSLKSKDMTPFQLTASFKDESLYYNYSTGQTWGDPQKIKTPFFVFHAERYFEILVLPESGTFRLAINGTPLGDFSPPTLDLKSIDELQINGSALLYSVHC